MAGENPLHFNGEIKTGVARYTLVGMLAQQYNMDMNMDMEGKHFKHHLSENSQNTITESYGIGRRETVLP